MVVDEQGNEDESKPLLWSERTSLLTKCLTEPTLLEMYENGTSEDLSGSTPAARLHRAAFIRASELSQRFTKDRPSSNEVVFSRTYD